MIGTFAITVVIALAVILAYAASKPDTFRVERSTSIQAPPEKIFPLIDDFHSWPAWSPYEKLDPAMKRTLTGAERGKGAIYEWEGNGKAGAGRMEMTNVAPPSQIDITLDFTKPFRASNLTQFTLVPRGESTRVSWAMSGRSPYVAKVMTTFFSMDKMVGKDFEAGLANLKTIAERSAIATTSESPASTR